PNGDKHGGAVCDDPHVRICERRMNTSCAYSILWRGINGDGSHAPFLWRGINGDGSHASFL
ncbi:hypothetical protein, partial [Neobacillus cucumis]|uniref:hypothetical protein n=1 Tax=Neobacillus cucumis TaxID=1740721 RepID=UPI0019633FC5